jgi:NAD(P)H dehydrogenase (quinone)
MIVVTGANGHLGKSVIDFLLKKGVPSSAIAALVRDESKAAELTAKGVVVRIGDYDRYDMLLDAFEGADRFFWCRVPTWSTGADNTRT